MNNLSVAKRLSLGFAAVLALLCVIVGIATWKMAQLADNANYYAVNLVPSFKAQKDIAVDLGNVRRFEYRHILSGAEAEMNGLEARIDGFWKRTSDQFDLYAKAMVSDAEDKRLMDKAKAAVDGYRAQGVKLRQLSRLTAQDPSKSADAAAFVIGPSALAYEAAHAAISDWWDHNVKLSDLQDKESAATYASAKTVMFALAASAIILGLLAAYLVTRSLLGELGGEPAMARDEAQRIARGDLTGAIPVRAGDTTSLFAALQLMHKSFVDTVSHVRESSESVATASTQIAQGNQDLSQRTEEQASALQQTAATMEQLNTTVRNNADSAKQANQLAQGASAVAAQGGEVVGQVVSTMQGISDSSRRIGDIIGVIDGIAFQTNILALNAAVEAARAGEQGRGFAVVAGEVRSLAQRSAEAAKEIKTLIGRSVEQVEQGTVLVNQAGKTMSEIVGSVKRVSDIVAEISSASQEQSSGISQVGDAVGQMDRVTQQNAALVEESAAAAESLKGQAQQLVQAVAVFKLSGQQSGIVATAANAPTADRRGPDRAHDISRPAFKAKPASAGARTGTDDWTSF